jgi:staphylococcal nuclease domain-containing protein 1
LPLALQECVFKVDYAIEKAQLGSVFIGNENLALAVVAAGWAKVQTSGHPLASIGL